MKIKSDANYVKFFIILLPSKKLGASSGIGKSLAAHLFKLGANIIISSRSATSLKACADEILSHRQENVGNQIICIPLDLEKLPEISVYVDNLKSALSENKLSSIDIIINNAGVSSRGPALDTTIETLQSIMVDLQFSIFFTILV